MGQGTACDDTFGDEFINRTVEKEAGLYPVDRLALWYLSASFAWR